MTVYESLMVTSLFLVIPIVVLLLANIAIEGNTSLMSTKTHDRVHKVLRVCFVGSVVTFFLMIFVWALVRVWGGSL